jgi:hypothetical protein
MVRSDLSYKPAAYAVKNLIARLKDVGDEITPGTLDYSISGGGADLRHLLMQKRDGTYVLALWQNVRVYDNAARVDIINPAVAVTVNLNVPMALSQLYGLNQTTPLASYGAAGQLGVNVPDEVVLLEMHPAPAVAHEWVGGSGAWSGNSNWSNGPAAGVFASAVFGSSSAGPHVVTVGQTRTIAGMRFDSADAYTLNGPGMVTIDTPAFGFVNVEQGAHAINVPLALARDTTFDVKPGAALTVTSLQPTPGAFVNKSGGGVLELNDVRGKGLHVSGGVVRIADGAAPVKIDQLSIAPGAKLDLRNNSLIVRGQRAGYWDGTAYTGIIGRVAVGCDGLHWDGDGIVTSMSAAAYPGVLTTLAAAQASDAFSIAGNQTAIFMGESVSASDTLVMYTWGGDANLSGTIDGDDYFAIDSHIGLSGSAFGYCNGDFTYDGDINGDDYFIIDSNVGIGQSATPFPTSGGIAPLPAVPEPVGLSALIALSMLMRRRRAR